MNETERFRQEIRKKKNELGRPDASTKAQYLALVERNWLKNFFNWMNSTDAESPGPIPNSVLCKDGKLDPSKRYGHDFGVVGDKCYDRIADFFKGGPKIVRPYVIAPGTEMAVFILEPITLTITYLDKIFRKVVDGSWTVGSIKTQLCQSQKINKTKYHFVTDSGKPVRDEMSIIKTDTLSWILEPIEKGAHIVKEVPVLDSTRGHGIIPMSPPMSYLAVCLQCLARIRPLTDLILSDAFDETPSGKGICTKAFVSVVRSLLEEGTGAVSATGFLRAFQTRTLWNGVDCATPPKFLRFMLETFTSESARTKGGFPIVDIFSGLFSGSFECPHCNNFDDIKSRFPFIDLSIPEMLSSGGLMLTDCIAAFSMPEKLGENGRMRCRVCKKNMRPFRTLTVNSVGDVLIFHIDRWSGSDAFATYNTVSIEYPDEIDVASFCASSSGIYSLVGVIFMSGKPEIPHYTCACLDQEEDQWLLCDDEKVIAIEPSGVHRSDVIMLMYQKSEM